MRGRDIKRYSYDWAGLWLIWIPWHFPLHLDSSIQGSSAEAEQAFMDQYPSVLIAAEWMYHPYHFEMYQS